MYSWSRQYPGVPKQLSEHDKVGAWQVEARVGGGDRQDGRPYVLVVLEFLTQEVTLLRVRLPIYTDVLGPDLVKQVDNCFD